MSEAREAGFYWVTLDGLHGKPVVAELLQHGRWELTGISVSYPPSMFVEIGPRVMPPAEIAAAIAAARAEGVAIGAANMRERCAGVAQSQGYEALAEGLRRVGEHEFPELADADAILRAERVKGAEAMRAAVKANYDERVASGQLPAVTARFWKMRLDALEVLP